MTVVHIARAIALLALALATGCGEDHSPRAFALPDFAVRGRWQQPMALRYRIDADGSPMAEGAFRAAVLRAIAAWNETGVVHLAAAVADDAEPPSVTFGFRRGHHGACEPFGATAALAHSGPTGTPTFVHFDAARSWSEDGSAGSASVFAVALHELGHVLGLGHSAAPSAVMNSAPERNTRLGQPDLDGLHSLYGGGSDRPADLQVRGDGARTVLRGVAPPDCTEFATFDTEGDGRDELLVWRTDVQGHGAVTVYCFGPSCTLLRTAGPFLGMTTHGARVHFAVHADGSRLLVNTLPNGRLVAQRFDDRGLPVEWAGDPPAPAVQKPADVDGDGKPETIDRNGQ